MRGVFAGPAIGLPTGSTSDKPPDAVAWTGSTPLTVRPSRISMYIRWRGTRDNIYVGVNIEEVIMPAKKNAIPPEIYQLKVTLLGTSPTIWPRLLVPADMTLAQL